MAAPGLDFAADDPLMRAATEAFEKLTALAVLASAAASERERPRWTGGTRESEVEPRSLRARPPESVPRLGGRDGAGPGT